MSLDMIVCIISLALNWDIFLLLDGNICNVIIILITAEIIGGNNEGINTVRRYNKNKQYGRNC